MTGLDRDMRLRVYILDSLIAKSGEILTPTTIGDLTTELLERIIEVIDTPLYKSTTTLKGIS